MAAVPRTPAPSSPDDLGYEQARDELVDVVRRLEAGGTSLEESLALWERGEQLAAVCQRWLDGARARLEAVAPGGGSAGAAAAATDEDETVMPTADTGLAARRGARVRPPGTGADGSGGGFRPVDASGPGERLHCSCLASI